MLEISSIHNTGQGTKITDILKSKLKLNTLEPSIISQTICLYMRRLRDNQHRCLQYLLSKYQQFKV